MNVNLNTAAMTSKYVMSKASPIVFAKLNDDGVWEFWSKEIIGESEIMVVSLKQIVNIDPSVSQVLDLQPGFSAMRENNNQSWKIVAGN